jgi:hypothetical protein
MTRSLPKAHAVRVAAFVLLLATTAGCVTSTAPEDALQVSTETSTYTRDSLGYVTIAFSIVNAGGDAVYLPTCGGVVGATLDQRTGGNVWINSISAVGCFSSFAAGPYRLDPGQTARGTQLVRPSPGQYRLSVPIALSAIADANRRATSGPFTIS